MAPPSYFDEYSQPTMTLPWGKDWLSQAKKKIISLMAESLGLSCACAQSARKSSGKAKRSAVSEVVLFFACDRQSLPQGSVVVGCEFVEGKMAVPFSVVLAVVIANVGAAADSQHTDKERRENDLHPEEEQ